MGLVLLSIQYWPLNCSENTELALAKFFFFASLNDFGNTGDIKISVSDAGHEQTVPLGRQSGLCCAHHDSIMDESTPVPGRP